MCINAIFDFFITDLFVTLLKYFMEKRITKIKDFNIKKKIKKDEEKENIFKDDDDENEEINI
jgi:hypothetical protein